MTSGHEKQGKDQNECCAEDGKTWTEAAEKAQEELEKDGKVKKNEADDMRKHAGG